MDGPLEGRTGITTKGKTETEINDSFGDTGRVKLR